MRVSGQPVTAWRWLAIAAAVLGLTAVLFGAVGSHAVDLAAAGAEQRWNTALQIHFFQAAALMALAGLSASQSGGKLWFMSGLLQLSGTLLFCGNLYLRALQIELLPGWVTPTGGLVLLAGWLLLVVILLKKLR